MRLMLGSVSSVLLSRTSPVEAFDVSISGASADTVIVSSTAPISSTMSRVRNCWVPIRASRRSNVLKPLTAARTVYTPGTTPGNEYSPTSFDAVSRTTPVSWLTSETVAPGITPCASLTVPRRPPWNDWANATVPASDTTRTTTISRAQRMVSSRASVAAAAAPGSRRLHAVLGGVLHGLDEGVDLLQRRVDVRRHAQPGVVEHLVRRLATDDGVDHDPVAVHHELRQRARVDAVDADHREPPRLSRLEAGQNLDARVALDRIRPAHRQVAKARGFPLAADRLVERERFADRSANCGRIGADRLELADVVDLALRHGLQRPQLRNVLAADVEQAVADRREQPFVQADAVVITLEIANLEREVRDR